MDGGCEGIVTLNPKHPDPTMVYFRENPIERRTWTFQEKMLSPRKLVYSNTNLRWICESKTAYDGGGEAMLGAQVAFPLFWKFDRKFSPKVWRKNISEYSRRSISWPSDKLPAVAALAEEHAEYTGDQYFAGLWHSSLAVDLMWIVESDSLTARRPPQPRAPSWSWAAVEEPIGWAQLVTLTIESFLLIQNLRSLTGDLY
jgi:hypothetical protein